MIYSLPPERPMSQSDLDMIEEYLANKRNSEQSKEFIELTKAKEKLKTLSVEQLVKMTGYTKNYCYRIKRGDEPLSQKLIQKLGV